MSAAVLSRVISGTVMMVTAWFAIAFSLLLFRFFPSINSASGFFGSANALLYLTIEGLFLSLVLYASYVSVRRKEEKL